MSESKANQLSSSLQDYPVEAPTSIEAMDATVNELNAGKNLTGSRVVNGPPTYENVSYGSHDRNVLDFWQAKGAGPRPVLVWIHGGGWRRGSKDEVNRSLQDFYDAGISIAVISYRLVPNDPLPAPVHDGARAVQFLRSKAAEWDIDKLRIAAHGTSAGGCTVLYLLFRKDLADQGATDPILRESSRLIAGVSEQGQTSIDPKFIEPMLGRFGITHPMIWQSVGEESIDAALANYEHHAGQYHEFSPINHVNPGDPPVFLIYSQSMNLPAENSGHGIHHPMFGIKLKEVCDRAGVECHLITEAVADQPENSGEFLMRMLLTD